MARARWRLWDGSPLRHRGFRFSRDAQSIRECALHGLVGIPPCALQRRLAASCASRRRIRSGPVVSAAHPARAIRRMSAQALPLAPLDLRHASASLHLGARVPTLREARRGGGDTRRSKRRRRDAQDAAIALARRDGRYSDQAPRCAGAVGLRALRRMRARQPAVRRRSASRSSALTECAGREMPPP